MIETRLNARRLVLARKQRANFTDRVPRLQAAPFGGTEVLGGARETELGVNFPGGAWNEWPEQNGDNAADFCQVIEHLVQARGLGRVLRKLERSGLFDVLVR